MDNISDGADTPPTFPSLSSPLRRNAALHTSPAAEGSSGSLPASEGKSISLADLKMAYGSAGSASRPELPPIVPKLGMASGSRLRPDSQASDFHSGPLFQLSKTQDEDNCNTEPLPKMLIPSALGQFNRMSYGESSQPVHASEGRNVTHSDTIMKLSSAKFDADVAQRAATRSQAAFMVPAAPPGGFFYTMLSALEEAPEDEEEEEDGVHVEDNHMVLTAHNDS